ncbi:hypothetical protein [Gluconobacter morbifer]|uniref:Uncharacterized protein n=1 Tax=Gluconobacter morbifer G707 TaxID=1088869 RepID=G6XL73_9PROT|nr:hypothetical protein [Gluconobacter morbifer]EHH67501.1 hypothetical protein GMO_24960 [Gluconobacter morbifer G707]
MLSNKLKILFFTFSVFPSVFIFLPFENKHALGKGAPYSYVSNNKNFKPTLITTGINAELKPIAPTYRGSDGAWHETTVVSQICGVDSNGTPQTCPQLDSSTVLLKSEINEANGVAGLNAAGNMTAPIDTANALTAAGSVQLGSTTTATVLPNDADSSSTDAVANEPLVTTGFRWNSDPWENPDTVMIGGKQPWQSGALAVYGAPWTYGNVGSLVDIEMGNSVWSDLRGGSGDFDAIAEFVQASNTTPYYKVGADFTDDTGVTHTLTFDTGGVTVTPALPDSFTQMWNRIGKGGAGVLVYTNLMAAQPTMVAAKVGFPAHQTPNLWSGYITGVTTSENSTHLDMSAGWHSSGAWVGVNGTNSGAIPDTSVGLDQVFYSAYSHPLLVIGTYNQAFAQNTKCALDYPPSSASGTKILKNDAPVNSCQGNELDVYVPSTKPDGWMHAQGFTAVLQNSTPLVSPDSASFIAQGNWPTAFQTGLGTDGRDFFGGVLDVNSRRGPAATTGSTTEIMEAMQGTDAPTDVRSNMLGLRMVQRTDTLGTGGVSGVHYPADNSLHLGEWIGGSQFGTDGTTTGQYGIYKGDLSFNPSWAKGGVALCGADNGFADSATACMSVLTDGSLMLGAAGPQFGPRILNGVNGLHASPGGFIQYNDGFHMEVPQGDISNVTGNGATVDTSLGNNHAWLTWHTGTYNFYSTQGANSDGSASTPTLMLKVAESGLTATGYTETLTTPTSSSAPCTAGQFTDDANYHYVCVAENTWKRVALSTW